MVETLRLHIFRHPPFYAGEEMLNECMINYGGFDHNVQTLRIVMLLENKYLNFKGLNLTADTLDGLLKHNGPLINITKNIKEINGVNKLLNSKFENYPSLKHKLQQFRQYCVQ